MKNFIVTAGQVLVGAAGIALAAFAGAKIGEATGMAINKMSVLKVEEPTENENEE